MSTKSTFETNAAAFIGSGERTTTKFPVAEYIRFSKGLADASGHQLAIYKKDGEIFVIRRSAKSWSTKPALHLEDFDQFNVTLGDQPDTLIITHPDQANYYNIDLAKGKINMVCDKPQTGRRIHEVLVAAAEAWGKAYAQALLTGVEAIHPLITTQDENEVGEPTTARALAAADAQELAELNPDALYELIISEDTEEGDKRRTFSATLYVPEAYDERVPDITPSGDYAHEEGWTVIFTVPKTVAFVDSKMLHATATMIHASGVPREFICYKFVDGCETSMPKFSALLPHFKKVGA